METIEKITTSDLILMEVGEQKVFEFPSWNKARSAQSYANQFKRSTAADDEPMEFKTVLGNPCPKDGHTVAIITRIK